jgi:hypothetical protein
MGGACLDCARAGNVSRCVSCLVEARPNFCPVMGLGEGGAAPCISAASQACRMCADRSPSYDRWGFLGGAS